MVELEHTPQVHLDSRQLRKLAHPLRSRLLAVLRTDGPSTSARLADALDTNTGQTSYHLRQLAEVGLVQEVPERGTARERWWQAVHQVSSWAETDFEADPDDQAAVDWLMGANLRTMTRWREEWLASRRQWPEAWRRAATFGDMRLRLDPERLEELVDELWTVLDRYRAEEVEDAQAEDVVVMIDAFPARDLRP